MYAPDQRGRDAVDQLLHISQAKPILPPKPPELQTISISELSRMEIAPIPHIVEELFPAGLCIFAAPQKTGKSWFSLALAEAVSLGKPFLGRRTMLGSVLYLDLESNKRRLKGRMRAMNLEVSDRFDVAFRALSLRDNLIAQLTAWYEKHPDAKLAIIDTLICVKGSSPRGVDAYTADSELLAPLQTWAIDRNIAVVVVTHLKKKDVKYAEMADPFEMIVGSGGQFGIADTALIIAGQRNDEQKHLIVSGRDLEAQDIVIAFDKTNCRWQCIGDAETVQRMQAVKSPIVRTILDLLERAECGIVNITAQGLLDECAERYGTTEQIIPAELGRRMKMLAPTIESFGVRYEPPKSSGRKGRMHRFVRTAG